MCREISDFRGRFPLLRERCWVENVGQCAKNATHKKISFKNVGFSWENGTKPINKAAFSQRDLDLCRFQVIAG